MKLARACIATAALVAITVMPSTVSAVELTHPTGTRASVGTKIQGTNVAHASIPTQVVVTTSMGNITCGRATITGEITKNDGGAAVEGNITTAEFAGTHGVTAIGHCQGSGILGPQVFPTPSHTSDETKSLPWCIRFEAEDTVTLRGGKCSEASRPITFTFHGDLTCGYEKASVTGTYTTHLSAALMGFTNQTFSKSPGSSVLCPSTGTLHMAFTLETDTTTPNHVYIDK